MNERARAAAVDYRLHGMSVQDPYRALERDSELTRAWMAAQTERTERALSRHADPAIEQRLQALLDIGYLDGVAAGGERVFVVKREGEREQAALYLVQDGVLAPQPLIDPAHYGERAALDWFYPSPGGRYVAFGISDSGDERSQLRVLDVEREQLLPQVISHAKWSNLSWLHDESGFYYTRYPAPGEPRHDAAQEDTYFPALYFHRLDRPDDDVLVFQSEEGSDIPAPSVSEDDRWLVVVNFHGWSASDVYLFDRENGPAPGPEHPLRPVALPADARSTARVHRGRLYVLTNAGAPRWRILAAPPEHAAKGLSLAPLIEQGAGKIEDFLASGDRLVVHYLQDVRSRLRVFDLDGQPQGEIELPTRGSVDAMDAAPAGGPLYFTFSSFFHPPTLYAAEPGSRRRVELYQVAHEFDASRYTLGQASVASADGTPVNVYYVHARGLTRNRDNPVLLYGYGGFDVPLLPSFTRNALYWLERGGVYAVANLRGGGEFGEAWHEAGTRERKPRVFEDFEAVLDWLSDSGISRPQRIAITGGSNGGLLVGAMITRSPQRFAAAAAYVGLYDMLRYPLFPPARLWVGEYGDPGEPQAARYLHAYSPYHNVRPKTRYPAVLIETADHDTRVFWGHSTKFAARLQTAQAGEAPIYFYLERDQGHGSGTRHSDLVDRLVRRYAFIESALGMR